MILRTARPADLPALVTIYNQAIAAHATAFLDPVSVADRQGWFAAHTPDRRPILIAERDGDMLGWCSLSDYRPGRAAVRHAAEISYYVDETQRRQGVASALVRDALARCPALGIRTLFAIVLADNEASLAVLERFGFARWGRLPNVADFDGRRVDHVYCGLELEPPA
ncbi:GNAT family N-acetyltransferase [Planctomycetota bacterium]|nr:GNAT family N-acetyltransferase [Planctomycetota bacterium]